MYSFIKIPHDFHQLNILFLRRKTKPESIGFIVKRLIDRDLNEACLTRPLVKERVLWTTALLEINTDMAVFLISH